MCTLTLAWRVFDGAPVVAAANRDEVRDRPSEPPAEIQPGVFAPRDAEAGGTWIGATDDGLFVGLTNRWVDGLTADRSRGLLVRDCLDADSAEAAARAVERAVRETGYDGFNLLVADETAAILLEWDGHLSVQTLDPGVHVLGNVGLDGAFYEPPERPGAGAERGEAVWRLRDHLRPEPGEDAAAWRDRAATALANHEFGACVHADGYGTVSASLVTVGDGVTYDFADGPPCETAFERVVPADDRI
ncbi:NRDE family protein [Halobaculum sp. MBLA0143]|uniref:NRDE family protein n=1 Tax=Halobaculum sp. MBLA0143 TaxID=3079933 RepID=UPI0035234677